MVSMPFKLHPATLPAGSDPKKPVPLELLASIFAMNSGGWDAERAIKAISPKDAHKEMLKFKNLLNTFKSDDGDFYSNAQFFSRKLGRVKYAYERRIEQLQREQKMLMVEYNHCWKAFDRLLMPYWHLDEKLVPIHQQLADFHARLIAFARSRLQYSKLVIEK